MSVLHSALDIVDVAGEVERSTEEVAEVYSALDGRLNLHWLWRQAAALPSESHWLGLARKAMLDDVANQLRDLPAGSLDMSMVSVALRELRALVPAPPCEPGAPPAPSVQPAAGQVASLGTP